MTGNRWLQMIAENPDHSERYIERFRTMAADGADLNGEARFVDAMVGRGARILDAGCGPGRVGGRLAELGHAVVGVDIDPALIAAAEAEHPGSTWLTGDLATVDLSAAGADGPFDVIVCAGNVVTFLDPDTRRSVAEQFAAHLAAGGRVVVGFGTNRGYEVADFAADTRAAGLAMDLELSSWHLHPYEASSDFLVAVLSFARSCTVLPEGLEHIRTTEDFDETSVPAGLLRAHRVADGVWGRLVVHSGSVRFVFEDEPEQPYVVTAGNDVAIPPARHHHVELVGPVSFAVEFHRFPATPSPTVGTESTALAAER